MSLSLVRRELLQSWLNQHKITQTQLAKQLDVQPSYISCILHKSVRKRDIGENLARRLEESLGMAPYYLDGVDRPLSIGAPRAIGEIIAIPRLHRSKNIQRVDETSTVLLAAAELQRREIRLSSAAWMSVEVSDMAPAIPRGATLIIDTSDTQIQDGRAYALGWGDQLVIRRAHLVPAGIRLSIDSNPSAAITLSPSEMRSQVSIAGCARMMVSSID
ncbi:hypothetical protein LNV23_19035 [Paucibacter sp. DJ1R-11]|uniref:XRE family transcriptional regulator n=1 Tax=Paucibacter sp. DJ1R-11 TaxID=2893556 RepID=UPI0021E46ED2|nr:XRE family transcriptional regulator [Paucibacter sp. DJ1R-11]MCV2365549.1 hypothetical protein [Paucibacter sp. DJ1R-11]